MSDPLRTIESMNDTSAGFGSDGDVAELAQIVAGVESVDATLRQAEVAQLRWFARAGQLAEGQAAGATQSVKAHEMALRSIAAELSGILRASDRTVQRRIDEARTVVEDYPATLTAWEDGRITRGHVRVIVDAGCVVPAEARERFEAEAIARCEKDTPNRVKEGLEILAERFAERSFTDRHRDAARSRCVRVIPGRDGMSDVIATVPTVIADGIFDRLTQQAHRRQRRDLLAAAGFAHQRNGFALADRKADAPHRRHQPPVLPEPDPQVFDLQDRGHRNVFLGSKASRTPSKMKTSSDSMMAKLKKAVKPSQGACRFCLACRASSPSEGAELGRPYPR